MTLYLFFEYLGEDWVIFASDEIEEGENIYDGALRQLSEATNDIVRRNLL